MICPQPRKKKVETTILERIDKNNVIDKIHKQKMPEEPPNFNHKSFFVICTLLI